jgi:uncharacterized membrane protein YczE
MLPLPDRYELRRRLPRLIVGLVLFGLGVAFMVAGDLGLSPWEVFHQGISFKTGIPIGTVGILTGLLVLALWVPLRERFGIGTVMNVILIGIVIDLTLWLLPDVHGVGLRWLSLLGGLLLVAIGTGIYIGAGLGTGPRDGVMTGLARRGLSIRLARSLVEVTVLVLGWLLGGTVGIGTVLFSFGIGFFVQIFLRRFSLEPLAA